MSKCLFFIIWHEGHQSSSSDYAAVCFLDYYEMLLLTEPRRFKPVDLIIPSPSVTNTLPLSFISCVKLKGWRLSHPAHITDGRKCVVLTSSGPISPGCCCRRQSCCSWWSWCCRRLEASSARLRWAELWSRRGSCPDPWPSTTACTAAQTTTEQTSDNQYNQSIPTGPHRCVPSAASMRTQVKPDVWEIKTWNKPQIFMKNDLKPVSMMVKVVEIHDAINSEEELLI